MTISDLVSLSFIIVYSTPLSIIFGGALLRLSAFEPEHSLLLRNINHYFRSHDNSDSLAGSVMRFSDRGSPLIFASSLISIIYKNLNLLNFYTTSSQESVIVWRHMATLQTLTHTHTYACTHRRHIEAAAMQCFMGCVHAPRRRRFLHYDPYTSSRFTTMVNVCVALRFFLFI